MSGEFFAEYEEVIRRPRFNRSDSEIEAALCTIREGGLSVKPTEKVYACSDMDDNIFLECAQSATAHYLITGNVRHFPGAWARTRIVTARQFLDAVV